MASSGLLLRFDAKSGKEREVEQFLRSALPLVEEELGTRSWFAVRFGHGHYGIFDTFLDEAARDEHLAGPVGLALQQYSNDLFDTAPRVQRIEVLADKMPILHDGRDTKGLLLTFKAKAGHESEVEQFLRDARPIVMDEPMTTAWFAIRTDDGDYGIFDVFPDNGGRLAHLAGQVPRELAKRSMSLLGSVPELALVNVQAEKLGA